MPVMLQTSFMAILIYPNKHQFNGMRKRLLLLFVAMITVIQVMAQAFGVKGRVVDDKNEPVIGASVMVKGTSKGIATDNDGRFTLSDVSKGQTIVVSYVGMKPVSVSAKPTMKIVMESIDSELDEVMVVAFGKQTRSSFTGSAGVLNSDDITVRQVSSPLAALDGKVAGVQMIEGNSPQSEPSIIIRGISSINAGTSPLIVLDGLPYEGYYSDINPADVESISVLKDAASTALYGARGANGVILITTKTAKRGKSAISVDAKWGVNSDALVDYDMIENTGQYYETYYKALYNYYRNSLGQSATTAFMNANNTLGASSDEGGLGFLVYSVPQGQWLIGENGKLNPNYRPYNIVKYNGNEYMLRPDNWKDEALRHGSRQEYNINISGGTDTFQAYASLGYLQNEGIVKGMDFERYTGRFKADWQARSWLKIGANMSYTHNESNNKGESFYTAHLTPSIYPVYIRDAEGNILTDARGKMYDYGDGSVTGQTRPNGTNENPLQTDWLDISYNNSNAFGFQGYAEMTFLKDFKFTANISVYDNEYRQKVTYNPYYGYNKSNNGELTTSHNRYYTINTQQLLNWAHTFGKHNVSALIGHEYNRQSTTALEAEKSNFISYVTHQELSALVTNGDISGSTGVYNVEGYLFRGQYDYSGKYFGSLSFRRDGSSRFHPSHRWGNFWSIGGAWLISKENWNLPQWVNMLKFKASIGQQGNDAIGNYYYTDYYSISSVNGEGALVFNNKGNRNITWETNTNFNTGFEFELFNRRLNGSIEYYIRKTTDMLMFFTSPQSIGYSGYYDNVGDMRNSGIEVVLDGDIIRTKNVKWSLNLNLTHNKNEVTSLPAENRTANIDGKWGFITSTGWNYCGEGLPINTWYLPRYAGVNDSGLSTWYVRDGDGLSTTTDYGSADYFLCGDPNPDLYGGFGTTVSAYGFDLSANFTYSIGGKAFDFGYQSLMEVPSSNGYIGRNIHKDQLNAWSETNTTSNIPRWQYNDYYANAASDRFLTDASYLVFKNISLGYTFPKKLIKRLTLTNMRIYVSCDNVAYWTKRKGFDPRSSLNGYTVEGDYSPMRTISGGISIKF